MLEHVVLLLALMRVAHLYSTMMAGGHTHTHARTHARRPAQLKVRKHAPLLQAFTPLLDLQPAGLTSHLMKSNIITDIRA
jgi:hypothetical protein